MIIDSFDKGAAQYPERAFIDAPGLRLTYAEAEAASHAVARALGKIVVPGGHVAILSPNHPMVPAAMLGVMRSGAVYVPLNARDAIEAIIGFAEFCDVEVLIMHSAYAEHVDALRAGIPTLKRIIGLTDAVEEGGATIAEWLASHHGARVLVRREAGDLAIIKASGGTTGLPKAIMQSHGSLETAYRIGNMCVPPRTDSPAFLIAAPLTHAAGATMIAYAQFGMRNVVATSATPADILETIQREKISHIFLPPTLIYRLIAHETARTGDFSALEVVLYGAAPMSAEKLREGIAIWDNVFVQCYGQAEVPGVITCLSRADHVITDDAKIDRRLASAGRPTGACEVALMDEEGRIVDQGERGEICARGALVSPGYYKNDKATAEARFGDWHRTGDIGVFDDNGYLYVVDRMKDMIITGGFNVYPSEIEQLIWGIDAVQDCAVVGVKDEEWGERVTAVVELKPGQLVTGDQIIALCKAKLGSVKAPKDVLFWDNLPRSPVGKVLKKDIRNTLSEGTA